MIGDEKLMDIAVIAVLAISGYFAITALNGGSAVVAEEVASTRTIVDQLTATRDRLQSLPDMQPLTSAWMQSREITSSCGVERTVITGEDRDSQYAGAGQFWTAQLSGDAIAVLACADQLSELDQVAFEDVEIVTDDQYQVAQVTFSMYGTFTPE
ncbi:hypothetical protein J7355_13410 [Endozoicomonas sp. G2_2]|uniref:hypothetical protein n=1 Tax=Endozoicomonas sp. G2_2 TaxID=2821092 RepID=UPI001AD98E10|nr:hypothetical protein [Endozoicomonas sp. G2_2]MBO9471093.1 hypothetical protein [Endozoicomonas sp. G2_2]